MKGPLPLPLSPKKYLENNLIFLPFCLTTFHQHPKALTLFIFGFRDPNKNSLIHELRKLFMGWINLVQRSPFSTHERGTSIYNSITWSSNPQCQCTIEAFATEQPLSTCLRHYCLYESSSTQLYFLELYPSNT